MPLNPSVIFGQVQKGSIRSYRVLSYFFRGIAPSGESLLKMGTGRIEARTGVGLGIRGSCKALLGSLGRGIFCS
jgi:hypothetical protein